MAIKHLADVPMGAFWVRRAPNEAMPNHGVDLRESASVAHLYGQNLVAAESLTANSATNGWIDSPRILEPVADHMLALGLNQFVIHTSVHQPLVDAAPGLTLGSSDRRLQFGLAEDSGVKAIEIRWPSGKVQTLENIGADRVLGIVEPA
jgi:alpha-L-rhamnosidase/ASPIC and UnbV